jgi:outer membrane biosynthesis protein TonB
VELFVIQCTTCHARLKVNDESVIGDILGCPKCGSMVQVVPPVDWKRSQSAAAVVAAPVTSAPASQPQPATKPAAAAAIAPPKLPARPATQPSDQALPKTTSPAPAPAAGAPAGSRAAAHGNPEWFVWGGTLLAGIAFGLGAWFAFAWLTAPDSVPSVAVVDDNMPPARVENQQQGVVPERTPMAPNPDAAPKAEKNETNGSDPQPAESAGPAAEVPKTADAVNDTPPPVAEKVTDEPKAAEPAEERPSGIRLDPVKKTPSVAEQPDVSPSSVANEPFAADDSPPAPAKPAKPAADATSAADAATVPQLTGEEIDERLGGPLPSVSFAKVPLAQFVEFIGDFSGLVIAIDDASLAKVGKKRQTPVTIKLSDTTAREALRAAVSSLGLTCVVRNGQLVVVAGK